MSFKKEVEATCLHHAKKLGFEKKGGSRVSVISEGWQGWLGLNSSGWTSEGGAIYPIIGVVCDEIQNIYHEILPPPSRKRHISPTISIPLGYAAEVPKLRQWFFSNDGTLAQQAANLASAVEEIGLPYIRRHASLDAIRATLAGDNWIPNPRMAREKLSVTILVQSGPEAARAHIQAELDKIAGKDDPSSQVDRDFAERFLAYLNRTAL
ncbi:hypothetical protein [Rathayibacter iranicus]|uniref:hypothetical protein n=1 Tax=Rathayibacter iranicus TaxID=59737 RepID=UPI0011B01EFE|nr:hypothetical protein [Rathayibacter iranicus]